MANSNPHYDSEDQSPEAIKARADKMTRAVIVHEDPDNLPAEVDPEPQMDEVVPYNSRTSLKAVDRERLLSHLNPTERKAHVTLTPERMLVFLEHVAKTGRRYEAALVAGVSYETVRRHRKANDFFAEAWETAVAIHRDGIDREIARRGIEGVDEPVWQKGEFMGYVRKYSDSLLLAHAKKHDPAYRDKAQVDHNVSGGVLVVGMQAASTNDWMQRFQDKGAIPVDAEVTDAVDSDGEVPQESETETQE